MTDPTPGEDQAPDSLSDVERQSRIEQLLVSGLDEYFAGRLDHAINVWTLHSVMISPTSRTRCLHEQAT